MGPRNLCLMTVWFTLKFENHWLHHNLQRLVELVWGYRWTLTSFMSPGKCSQNWEQLIYTNFFNLYPRTLSPVRLNDFSNLSGFMLFLCFQNKEIRDIWFLLKQHNPIWDRDNTRSQLFQPPVLPIRVPPPP